MTNRLVDFDDTTTTLNTSVAETTLTTLSIPAYGLAADYAIRLTVAGDLLNNTGGADTVLWKVKLGATALLTTAATSFAASASRRKWRLVVDVLAESDSVQRAAGTLWVSAADAVTFSADGIVLVGYGTGAETGTDQLDMTVTATLGSSSANLEITHKLGLLESVR